MEWSGAPREAKSGYHAQQSKAMVTMHVGNEHRLEFGEAYPAVAQVKLRTLPAIHHKELTPHFHYLR